MNIFVLSFHPLHAAELHCDQHLSSQPKEATQMLSTCIRLWHEAHPDTEAPQYYAEVPTVGIYKSTHASHPCTKWLRHSSANMRWFVSFTSGLFAEFAHRSGKLHGSQDPFINCLTWIKNNGWPAEDNYGSPHAQAMPDEYKTQNAVDAYRAYYRAEKSILKGKAVTYTKRDVPAFMRGVL